MSRPVPPVAASSMSDRAAQAIRERLSGKPLGRFATVALFAGPAVMASIAYMDPGNFATNVQAGAAYGYSLLWVVLFANIVAMLFQALSAKLGIVTGRHLAEHCRDQFPPKVVFAMWILSEIAAMATDLAEFVGGAIGFSLLFHVPMMLGMLVTAAITYGLLLLDRGGFRPMELVIGALVALIGLCYLAELFIAPVDWSAAAKGTLTPSIPDAKALTVAVGIIGATVMPHALYLHSALTSARPQARNAAERATVLRFSNREVLVALAGAGLVNMAMVAMAAAAFHQGHSDVAEIETAYHTLTPLLGAGAATIFLISLLASGVSSSVVGTMAGQVVMQGFIRRSIPLWARRAITMAPAFVVVAAGVNVTQALVVSQVVLSLTLPVPMIALLIFTRRRDIMGAFANGWLMQGAAVAGAVVILALNVVLLLQTAGVAVPGLS
jgi:manganese transport protein